MKIQSARFGPEVPGANLESVFRTRWLSHQVNSLNVDMRGTLYTKGYLLLKYCVELKWHRRWGFSKNIIAHTRKKPLTTVSSAPCVTSWASPAQTTAQEGVKSLKLTGMPKDKNGRATKFWF